MTLSEKFTILTYNVGIITKNIDSIMSDGVNKGDITWLRHGYRDRFFADPFLINSDDKYYYILCEEYLFFEEKGKITLLTIKKDDFELVGRKVIIEEPYHLSFPYCKYRGAEIIPESCASHKSFKYTINPENYSIIKKEEILNEGVIDATILNDGTTEYLYATKHPNPLTQTLVYEGDGNGKFKTPGKIIVDNDLGRARGAGDFFLWKGNLYRAVQDCNGRYGRQTKIVRIDSLGNEYKATDIITINSFENPPFNETMHTFNVYDDCVIVDGSKDCIRFPAKFFYKKMRFLFSKRLKA